MPLGFLVIYVVSLFTKAPSAEMHGLRRRDPQAARQDGARREDLTDRNGVMRRGPAGPRFFFECLRNRS